MPDIKMDAQKAAQWTARVKNEIADVNKTLKRVNEVCNTFPGEDDVFIRLIEKTGNMMNTTWDYACNEYQKAWKKVEDGIDNMAKQGQKVAEKIENFVSKFGK